VQEVYNLIASDLDAAISNFEVGSPRPSGSAFDKANLNIDVAYGLKARMAMATGDWATAASSAAKCHYN